MMHRLLNLSLRGGGMVGKFLLIFILARLLPPAELGIYGLLTATVGYALYFVGLDFYTYSSREMLHADKYMWPAMLRDQAVLFVSSYVVVLPSLVFLFWADFLPVKYALVFYVLLVVEHLSQELYRLLVTIGKPMAAGVSLFIRSGAWCYVLVVVYLSGYSEINLHAVMWMWVIADVIVVIFGAWLLRKLPWDELKSSVDWVWIRKGLKVAGLLLIGTIALRGILTIDRYFVETYAGLDVLGVYTLYMGICFSLIGFVDAAVFSFRYPILVSLYKSGQYGAFKVAERDFARQTLIAVIALAIVTTLLAVPVLEWVGKPIYLQHIQILFILLAASIFFIIGHVPHYVLYAMGRDRSIVRAHVSGLGLFVALSFLLASTYGMSGIAISLCGTFAYLGLLKQWHVSSLRKASITHGMDK
ncbi:MAG: oligosaccharide flippase family protein [Gallionella sp.]|nr:oligosaccharide flippase family protein [Gallionella sp.]